MKSRSLHSSTEFFGGSKRWSRKLSDIVPWKSSIGLISSKISSRPDLSGIGLADAAASSTLARHTSLPRSQSKLLTCRSSRSGTGSGSAILAKLNRELGVKLVTLREGAKRRPSKLDIRTRPVRPPAERPARFQAHGQARDTLSSGAPEISGQPE